MRGKRKVPSVSIIAAMDSVRGIGKGNKLMWHIGEDMKHFKEVTSGHVVIMGRKTFESIGRPLPNRVNIVVTSNREFKAKGITIANSFKEALEIAREKEDEEIFVIGGGQIYEQAIPIANKLYLTIVEGNFGADTFFPNLGDFGSVIWEKSSSSEGYRYKFLEIERRKGNDEKK